MCVVYGGGVEGNDEGYGSAFGEDRCRLDYPSRHATLKFTQHYGVQPIDRETASAVNTRRIYIGGHREGTGLQWVDRK